MLSNKIIHCETYEEALEIWDMFDSFDYFKAEPSYSTYDILEASDLLGTSEVFSEDFSIEDLLGGDL